MRRGARAASGSSVTAVHAAAAAGAHATGAPVTANFTSTAVTTPSAPRTTAHQPRRSRRAGRISASAVTAARASVHASRGQYRAGSRPVHASAATPADTARTAVSRSSARSPLTRPGAHGGSGSPGWWPSPGINSRPAARTVAATA
ncbi:hypothetical protein E1287_19080 [Actinomadura sp. KC06]|uniref:hypothetical protein n=1 Tax=Actinomadura sp. KC06 TaxID=2530369 RepID=UPI00104BDA22|nr:hypothetical protein [Actinomadura sp. KC06]TDD33542.1 hypothetical protein E1287_19080 [Actinomadura sp. KC06]